MAARRTYLVKEVAALSGVTVRTLHHYDALGLLVPGARSAAGYRLYSDDDLLRLQQILIGRELGWSLEAIRHSLDDPRFDRRAALVAQRAELVARAGRAHGMIEAIDAALAVLEDRRVTEDTTMDMKSIFDGFDHEQYADEARQRWGHTEAYKVSEQRWKSYTKAELQQCQDEQTAIYVAALGALESGVPPGDERAMDIAEQHRLSFDRWFYPCSPRMHARLADMWETDTRYAATIDKFGAGLTAFLAAAVRANAARGEPSA